MLLRSSVQKNNVAKIRPVYLGPPPFFVSPGRHIFFLSLPPLYVSELNARKIKGWAQKLLFTWGDQKLAIHLALKFLSCVKQFLGEVFL